MSIYDLCFSALLETFSWRHQAPHEHKQSKNAYEPYALKKAQPLNLEFSSFPAHESLVLPARRELMEYNS